MPWSYSASRTFQKCQVKWFLDTLAAHHRAADPIRRRAHFFSALTTVSAWRGQLVDTVISKHIIPSFEDLTREEPMGLQGSLSIARRLFTEQLAYAAQNRAATIDVKFGDIGDRFALLMEHEFEDGPTQEDLDRAWLEIETALSNFWDNEEIQQIIYDAEQLITQPRTLHFELVNGTKAVAIPDLIAFNRFKAHTIVDWKVHAEAGNDARRQLAVYAVALSRGKQHKDFPENWKVLPTEIDLVEAQLLLNQTKHYRLSEDDVAATTAYMDGSAYEMDCLTDRKSYKDIDVGDLRLAHSGLTCAACQFKTLCPEVAQ